MSSKLIDESPMLVLPSLATALGVNDSILLQQLYFECKKMEEWPGLPEWAKKHDGRLWLKASGNSLHERYFPFWKPESIRKMAKRLESKGLLLSAKLSENKYDQTLWYTVDKALVDEVLMECDNGLIDPARDTEWSIDDVQDDHSARNTECSNKSILENKEDDPQRPDGHTETVETKEVEPFFPLPNDSIVDECKLRKIGFGELTHVAMVLAQKTGLHNKVVKPSGYKDAETLCRQALELIDTDEKYINPEAVRAMWGRWNLSLNGRHVDAHWRVKNALAFAASELVDGLATGGANSNGGQAQMIPRAADYQVQLQQQAAEWTPPAWMNEKEQVSA